MQTLATGPGMGEVVGGRYRIDALIGGGGFGSVYRATQLNLGRVVALKLLHPGLFSAEGAHERFCREAALAQQLGHPNTVRLYDFGRTDSGLPYIVWEHLDGQPLDQLVMREGALCAQRVIRIATQVLKALMEAHALGIVHRDIKPSNLFVSDFSGEPDFVKVLDFGVAKTLIEPAPVITSGTLPVGTPSYMAPEQVKNEAVGAATDLYALGLVMAELLSGRPVVQGRSLVEVFMAQASDTPVSLPPEVESGPLGMVIRRATHKAVASRYGSAAEMLADLERVAHQISASGSAFAATFPAARPVSVTPDLVTALPAPRRSGSSAALWLAAGAIVLIGGVLVVGLAIAGYFGLRGGESVSVAASSAPPELDGIGAETVGRRAALRGWKLASDPVLNLEGTHQMQIVTLAKGSQHAVVSIYDFIDASTAERHAAELERGGIAVARDRDLLLSVEVRGDPTEARALLDRIVRE